MKYVQALAAMACATACGSSLEKGEYTFAAVLGLFALVEMASLIAKVRP